MSPTVAVLGLDRLGSAGRQAAGRTVKASVDEIQEGSGTAERSPSALAAEALALVYEDARRAAAAALVALDAASGAGDLVAASMAERALGLACREEGALTESSRHLRQSIAMANMASAHDMVAEARIVLLSTYAISGRFAAALREGRLAAAVLEGAGLARVQAQMATVLRMQGRLDDALAMYRQALRGLKDSDDPAVARLYNNRAVTHYHCGNLAAAQSDFERAERLFRLNGQFRLASYALQSSAIVVARQGDLPAALAAFAQADEYLRADPLPDPLGLRDRAIILLAARLVPEAHDYLQRAVSQLETAGQGGYLAEARLLLAEAELLSGRPAVARRIAEEAQVTFTRQRRHAWAALARSVAVRSAWSTGERSPELVRAARRTADALGHAGFLIRAADARLLAGRIALDMGDTRVARRDLAVSTRARRRGPVELRAGAWHAEALLRVQDGNRRGARAALHAGMRMLDAYRAAQGATDLRAHVAAHGEELAALGIRLAFEDGDAARILAWSERCRALGLRPRPVRPPRDARLAADLAELRQVVTETHEAALAGRPTARLYARQVALEERVRDRARHAPATVEPAMWSAPSRVMLLETLGPRALLEIVEHDGVLYGVTAVDGRLRLHQLAPRTDVLAELERVRFTVRRLALMRGSAAAIDAACQALGFGLKRLDTLLLAPVAAEVGDRELVVVPPGSLHAVPWAALPSLGWRPVTVAPSAAIWHRAATASDGGQRVVLVAGPELPNAQREVAALARRHPGAQRLTGARATSNAVLAALDGADLAHVAAHGRFRTDNPLFSSLQLTDGPVTVYDLEGLTRAPRTLVLSACDSALSEVCVGEELMGLSASLLAIGTRSVVAATCSVPDDATRRLMLRLHAGLAEGLGPAAALAAAQRRAANEGPADLVTAVGFVCLGAG